MHDKLGLPNGYINTNESKKKYAPVYMFKTFVKHCGCLEGDACE